MRTYLDNKEARLEKKNLSFPLSIMSQPSYRTLEGVLADEIVRVSGKLDVGNDMKDVTVGRVVGMFEKRLADKVNDLFDIGFDKDDFDYIVFPEGQLVYLCSVQGLKPFCFVAEEDMLLSSAISESETLQVLLYPIKEKKHVIKDSVKRKSKAFVIRQLFFAIFLHSG